MAGDWKKLLFFILTSVVDSTETRVGREVSAQLRRDPSFKVGVILDDENILQKEEVEEALARFLARRSWAEVEVLRARVSTQNTLKVVEAVCRLVDGGAAAILVLQAGEAISIIQSIVSSLGIPLVRVDFQSSRPGPYCVNIAPDPSALGLAISSVLLPGHRIVIFYQDLSDVLSLEGLIEPGRPVQFVNLSNSSKIEMMDGEGINLVLARCNKEAGLQFVETLMLKGLLGPGNRIILPCLDLRSSDLHRYFSLGAQLILLELRTEQEFSLNSMLLVDGLDAVSTSLASLSMTGQLTAPVNLSCWSPATWKDGGKVVLKMTGTSFLGESGMVSLDQLGSRSNFLLRITETQHGQVLTQGLWSAETGYLKSEQLSVTSVGPTPQLGAEVPKHLVIATLLSSPYTMVAGTGQADQPPEHEGFAIDLAAEISKLVGFNYTLQIVSGYGEQKSNGSWNGLIGAILAGRADLAVADLTINLQREKVVDFSMPFLDLGISILFVSSPSKSINLFSFMTPLSAEVWVLMFVAGVSVSVTLYFIARVSPFETAELDSSEGQSPFLSLRHCFWFSVSSWVQQGCDFLPRALSTRTIASFWWFFTLIMISSYTANLAAFLTIERMDSPISSVQDLAKSDLKYGSIESGSTLSFFKDSDNPLYKQMWGKMKSWGDSLVQSNQEGIDKVLRENGEYAFFMESTSVDYQVERKCDLTKVGDNLDSKSYGVAMKKGSPLRSSISSAIIKLRQDGVLSRLKVKWWREERGGGACLTDQQVVGGVSRLTLENLGGIFLVLLLGLVLGSVLAVLEFLWVRCYKNNLFI